MRDIEAKMIGGVLIRAVVMMALALGAATAADDAVLVKDFGEQLHQLHQFDSSPGTTTAQPYCNAERLTEQIRLLRDRKAVLTEEIRHKEAEILGREMSAAERAQRRADLQGFIDGLVDVLAPAPASSASEPLEAEFEALVRELAKVEKQIAAIMLHIERCKNEEAGRGDRIQILRPF